MRDRTLMVTSGGVIEPSKSAACDICFSYNGKPIIVPKSEWTKEKYPSSSYTPIGVVVVPGSHNVYGDGSCGVMSLKYMDYNAPNEGSISPQSMCWGGYSVDTSLKNYTNAPYIGQSGNVTDNIINTVSEPYLPSDNFTGVTSKDGVAKYYDSSRSYLAPSPYGSDGVSRNPLYYQTTSPSSEFNCLADFNGVENTNVLTELATGQSNWKTASTISNSSGATYYPAACCCWRYSTPGTAQGDWYLPAAGEFGYVVARLKAINETIAALNSAYGSANISSVASSPFWSSTEYSSTRARGLDTNDGDVYWYGKYSNYYVRAFLRV